MERVSLKKNQGLIMMINIGLGFLLIIAMLFFVRNLIAISVQNKQKKISGSGTVRKGMQLDFQDYAVMVKNNPFGFPGGELFRLSAASAPQDSGNLTLIGVVSGHESVSFGIFMDQTGHQEVFRAGDAVYGIGTLGTIEKDRVFVGGGEGMHEMVIADISRRKTSKRGQGTGTASAQFSRKISDDTFYLDQRKVQRAIANPKELMTDARLLPNYMGGKQEGFVLSEVRPSGIYQSLGLENGDVLLRINEFDISHPEYALQAFTALQGMDRVQLDIIRNGSKMTMTYQIR
jgi:general secretion pathway protein C